MAETRQPVEETFPLKLTPKEHKFLIGRLDELEAEVAECLDGLKVIKIVLTVAHLNHDPLDCREENLRTLCQACHNRLAAPLRAQHASATRFKKRVGGTQEERPF